MKYFIGSIENSSPEIDEITDNPSFYVSDIEPIDVVNGNIVAWDELGNLYHFGTAKQLEEKKFTKNIAVVNVGKWDLSAGEPFLIKVADSQESQLREGLIKFLQRLDKHDMPSDYKNMNLIQLVDYAKGLNR